MPLQFQEEVIYDGRIGTTIMTFSLISYQDAHENYGDKKPISFAEEMRSRRESYIIFDNIYSGTKHRVSFEEILQDYQGIDLENSFLRISTRFMVKGDDKEIKVSY